jgi:hypothetical protein
MYIVSSFNGIYGVKWIGCTRLRFPSARVAKKRGIRHDKALERNRITAEGTNDLALKSSTLSMGVHEMPRFKNTNKHRSREKIHYDPAETLPSMVI